MKKLVLLLCVFLTTTIVSCESNSSSVATESTMSLVKKITLQTYSQTPQDNTKRIQYYANNQVIADTTFNHLNQWISRNVITENGNTKSYKTFNNSNQLIFQQDLIHDASGRLIEKRDVLPSTSSKTYVYNDVEGTVTIYTTFLNQPGNPSFYLATFYYHSNGLFFKESVGQDNPDIRTVVYNNLQPVSYQSTNNPSINLTYAFYPFPKPSNFTTSILEMNNIMLKDLTIRNINTICNFYPQYTNTTIGNFTTTHQATFNSSNYITNRTRTQVNNNNSGTFTEELIYFYN